MLDSAALRARLDGVRDRIARAAIRAGRDPASVQLVAVSKTFPPDSIRQAAAAGQIDFGENKVQEALAKQVALADLPLRWHFVGHLQSNKAKKTASFHAIHSIDDADLLPKLDDAASAADTTPSVLIQVDLSGEATKFGAAPDSLPSLIDRANSCKSLRLKGLMVIPPAVDDPEEARPFFVKLRNLLQDLRPSVRTPAEFGELSMGMSHDFDVAVEEGATIVRVGSAIFGDRGVK